MYQYIKRKETMKIKDAMKKVSKFLKTKNARKKLCGNSTNDNEEDEGDEYHNDDYRKHK